MESSFLKYGGSGKDRTSIDGLKDHYSTIELHSHDLGDTVRADGSLPSPPESGTTASF